MLWNNNCYTAYSSQFKRIYTLQQKGLTCLSIVGAVFYKNYYYVSKEA